MTSHSQSLLAGALALLIVGFPVDGRTQTRPDTARPAVLIILDDTRLVDKDRARLAAAGVDTVGRAIAETHAAVAAVSSGPGGLMVDLAEDPSLFPSIAQSISAGRYNFRGPVDDTKAVAALDATMEDSLHGLARQNTAALVAVIGRSAAVSDERRARLTATALRARRQRTQVLWLDLEPSGCERSPIRDSTILAEPAACGVLTEPAAVDRMMQVARAALGR